MNRYELAHQNLLDWYKLYGRHDLPWRNTKNIYHIYLSEIMLQQTQVSRVRAEYYPKFLEKFPTIKSLADASLDDVFSLWSGLGYYSRAKNLHKTAQLSHNNFPTSLKELLTLPGIGQYTASAICSFGYEQNIPVVDTNIARVIKRYFALVSAKDTKVWEYATQFVNHNSSRSHNLALMDLGSLICLPKNPKCTECPFEKECLGKDEAESYTKVKKKEYIVMELFFAVWIKKNKIALKVSTEKMYKDMLVLPNVEPIEENFIGKFKHSYTKYRLDVNLFEVEELSDNDIVWLDLEEFDTAPISSLTKKAKRFF